MRTRWRTILGGALTVAVSLVDAAAAAPATPAAGAEIVFQSGPAQTTLVELYTSEGCSSCPPAEAWLNGLGKRAGLWSEFVPVALHVNYWDHLGWRDPWASRQFTERQRAYARLWRSDTVYTPGVVMNGAEWRAWSGLTAFPRSTRNPGVLTARSADGSRWQIEFAPEVSRGEFGVSVAWLSRGLESNVRSGENRGRRLQHDFVAVGLVTVPLRRDGAKFLAEAAILSERGPVIGPRALAVWVTAAGELAPLQAVGGDLPVARR